MLLILLEGELKDWGGANGQTKLRKGKVKPHPSAAAAAAAATPFWCTFTLECVRIYIFIWDSSLVLSAWLSIEAHFRSFPLTGKNVTELGVGFAGLHGLTAARLGASHVILTDVALILSRLRRNVEANGAGEHVEVRELAWGSEELARGIGEEFDVRLKSACF
ncbi:hypothetical protein NL676_011265 [Syzygium grande]|nr:hypothetical protein NL676_011265 [Syzygium grande]